MIKPHKPHKNNVNINIILINIVYYIILYNYILYYIMSKSKTHTRRNRRRNSRRNSRRNRQRNSRRNSRRNRQRNSQRNSKKSLMKKDKLNIAILFSGRLTSYDKHYNNIMNNIVQGNNVDFYAGISTEKINKELLKDFIKLYKPVKWKYSSSPLIKPEGGWDNVKANKEMKFIKKNPMFMWRNRHNVMDLYKKSKKKYDWIISTRLDLYYTEKLNYNLLDDNKINIPNDADYGGYQDKIAIGKKDTMMKYLNLYKYMKNYLKKKPINPEPLLKYHLLQQKVPVKRIIFKHNIFPKVPHKMKIKNI